MSADILEFDGFTRLDLDPNKLLTKAKEADLSSVVIIGYDKDGEFYFASSVANGGSVLWDLEKAKQALLNVVVE